MSNPTALLQPGSILLGLVLGLIVGTAFFVSLRRNVALYVTQERLGLAIGLHLLRLAAVTAAFAGIIRLGAPALLGAFLSFLAVRTLMVRRLRTAP